MSSEKIVPPPVKWAQRNDLLYVDIAAECKDIDFKFTEDSMHFKGVDSSSNQKYDVTLNFYKKINPDKILTKNNRISTFVIYKQESAEYWPKLTNDKNKLHFLKVDFNKWVNEGSDDENEGGAGLDNLDLFSKLNSMDGSNKPSFDDFEDEEDSDDEDLPKLSSEQDEEEEKKTE